MIHEDFKYDIAISFAGENRKIAEEIANALNSKNYKVFYDHFEKANLWGADLPVRLSDVYKKESRFCLILISSFYAEKSWTNHERQAAISRALRERKAYILPVRLDDTELAGFPDTVGYIDFNSSSVSEIVILLQQKLGVPNSDSHNQGEISTDVIRKVLAFCYRRAIFARLHAQMSWEAMFESLSECRTELQKIIVFVEPESLQQLVANIIGELDFIERHKDDLLNNYSKESEYQINGSKLRIIAALLELKNKASLPFAFPESVTEEIFFRKEDASEAPSNRVSPDPWMRLRK